MGALLMSVAVTQKNAADFREGELYKHKNAKRNEKWMTYLPGTLIITFYVLLWMFKVFQINHFGNI